mmetsp:Transcript_70390/g.114351  ORF Transcript_70390/g.114351 Transcript_70390/m.114351 type:complete len:107 (-) Transcript_70390:586-906(-)
MVTATKGKIFGQMKVISGQDAIYITWRDAFHRSLFPGLTNRFVISTPALFGRSYVYEFRACKKTNTTPFRIDEPDFADLHKNPNWSAIVRQGCGKDWCNMRGRCNL